MHTNLIQLINLTLLAAEHKVLSNVNCTINKADYVAIIGANGVGKSTLLRLLCSLTRPSGGAIKINGNPRIGYAPDLPPLYPHDTVLGYLKFIAKLHKVDRDRIDECIDIANLGIVQNKPIATLSKGTQQRVNLAQAILNRPDLLILDEPTNGLDEEQSAEFCQHLKLMQKQGCTIVMASHLYSDFISNCDYMLKIHNKHLEKILPPLANATTDVTHDQHHYTT